MKKIYTGLFLIVLFWSVQSVFAKPNGEITINLTERQKTYEVDLGKNLLLRIVKDRSVKHSDFGWLMEVVKKPYRSNSRNLIYQNKTGTTADLSQVYAWHIGNEDFPNKRKLKVKGYRLVVSIDLIDPKTKGDGPDARFVSGRLKITW